MTGASMRITRRQLLQWATAAGVVTLGGCAAQPPAPLRIAIQPWCGYQFMSLAAKEGWLPTDVELVFVPTAIDAISRVREGDVHGAALTLDQALVLVDHGIALDIVLITNVSAGADVLLVRPEITTLADLRGRRIGAEATSLGVVMVSKLLEAAGLDRDDVQVVEMTEDHVASWHAHEMDALVTYEPALGQLQQLGLVPLFDTRSLPQTILDVLAIRRDALEQHDEQVRALVAGHFRALHVWRTNPIDTDYRLAPLMQVPVERVGKAFQGLDLPDEDYNRHYLEGPSEALLRVTADISAILINAGIIRSPVESRQLFTADFLPAAARRP
jgi:NitT/TauT family transport system substrate-binding protein